MGPKCIQNDTEKNSGCGLEEYYPTDYRINIIKQIAKNAGLDGSIVAQKVREGEDQNFGYDAMKKRYGNMLIYAGFKAFCVWIKTAGH